MRRSVHRAGGPLSGPPARAWTVRPYYLLAAVLGALALLLSTQSDAAAPRTTASGPTIPPLPDQTKLYGYNPWQDAALPFATTQTVRKAKLRFQIPTVLARTYYVLCSAALIPGPPATVAQFPDPCPGGGFDPPAPTASYGWYGIISDSYFYRTSGAPDYGRIPPVKVAMLAFGSIPVTATVNLSQTVTGRYYDPLTLRWIVTTAGIPAGTIIPAYRQYGRAPSYTNGQAAFALAPSISGTLQVRVSDVRVDGQPVDVGATCTTASPATLRLSAPAGWYSSGGVDPKDLKGKPGEFLPLNVGGDAGYLQGTVDIPDFTGCGTGGDDLDPLLSAMVSGPGNAVQTYSSSYLQDFCIVSPKLCTASETAAERGRTAALLRLARARTAAAQRSALRILTPVDQAAPVRIAAPVRTAPTTHGSGSASAASSAASSGMASSGAASSSARSSGSSSKLSSSATTSSPPTPSPTTSSATTPSATTSTAPP